MTRELIQLAGQADITITEKQALQFMVYMRELCSYNEHTNLTAIRDEHQVLEKHFVDSLLLLKAYDLLQTASLADVGTGAGFPGIPLLILRPDLRVTLIESAGKRVEFLKYLCWALNLEADILHMRVEAAGKAQRYREQYDVVTARAVAGLPQLSEYCLPLVRVGGVFAAMKGPEAETETEAAQFAIGRLGGAVDQIWKGQLPSGEERRIIVIEKREQTPANYPRTAGAIKKRPLFDYESKGKGGKNGSKL